MGELAAILTLTSLKSSSSAGWKFSHQDVPKLLGFDLEYFLRTLYLCVVYLALARGEEWGQKEGPQLADLHPQGRAARMFSAAEILALYGFPPLHRVCLFTAYLLCPLPSPCETNT